MWYRAVQKNQSLVSQLVKRIGERSATVESWVRIKINCVHMLNVKSQNETKSEVNGLFIDQGFSLKWIFYLFWIVLLPLLRIRV